MPVRRSTAILLPLLAGWLAAILAAVSYLAANDWFGAGDLPGMMFWTGPMVLLQAITLLIWQRCAAPKRWIWSYLLALLLGPAVGVLAYLVVAVNIGPWIGAFSFPVVFCWIFGGFVGTVLFAYLRSQKGSGVALGTLGAGIVALLYANAYARAPEPRYRLYLVEGITNRQVTEVWETVIGTPSLSGTGHDLVDGLTGAAASGHDGDRPVLTIRMQKRLPDERRDSLLARIRRSPLVARLERVDPDDTNGVRTSVSP